MEARARLTRAIREAASEEGFDRCAAAPVTALDAAPRLREWLRRGLHGEMAWLERNTDRRSKPGIVVPGARSVLVLARDYRTGHDATEDPRLGRVSRYAWGDEYHEVLGAAVRRLYERIRQVCPEAAGRYYVDTGPVMEKAWAELAGLGWIGKHTNLLGTRTGSWFFLAAIILDVDLDYGTQQRDHCGTCRACMDVCPTQAIIAPYVLDARRCISYLTIEHRGPIPRSLREPIGNRIFGCDDCQDVCPWNRFARVTEDPTFAPRADNQAPSLRQLMRLDADAFRRRFRHSPVRRAKYAGFLRNVAVALGNSGDPESVPVLAERLRDAEPLVRGHCAWALGRLGGKAARRSLTAAGAVETDAWVSEEIDLALLSSDATP